MDPVASWHALLRPGVELAPAFTAGLSAAMRERKLTFGERITCPFLRPFFLTEADEARMREAAERIAALGEKVTAAALESPSIFEQLGLTESEEALVRVEPGYACASTASRLDAFLLPDSALYSAKWIESGSRNASSLDAVLPQA